MNDARAFWSQWDRTWDETPLREPQARVLQQRAQYELADAEDDLRYYLRVIRLSAWSGYLALASLLSALVTGGVSALFGLTWALPVVLVVGAFCLLVAWGLFRPEWKYVEKARAAVRDAKVNRDIAAERYAAALGAHRD